MNCFVKPVEPVAASEPPFAAGGGRKMPPRIEKDPLKALDDLMAAIEALCPVWPARKRSIDGHKMLL
jgi:hypothetical protein